MFRLLKPIQHVSRGTSLLIPSRWFSQRSYALQLSSQSLSRKIPTKVPKTSRQTNPQILRRTKRSRWVKKDMLLESLQKESKIQPVTTVTSCEKYDFQGILDNPPLEGIHQLIPDEILYFKYQDEYDMLILENGTIVAWGLHEESTEADILPLFKEFMVFKYDFPESEDMDFLETSSAEHPTQVIAETFIINTANKDQSILEKAAFSSALSRSTRLAILENALEKHILQTRKVTEGLSNGKRLTVTEKELLRSTGRLFLLRGKLNLYSELIEIPDLYWSEPNLEAIYKAVSAVLDISPRISILNKKLDYATDESRALLQTLNEEKGTRLEWIIIYLIMIEVCFETFHFYERYVDYRDRDKE